MSRNSFSSRLPGKISPTTSKTWSVPELLADLAEPLEELVQHPPLAGVRRDEVEDEAVVLLAVAVDAAHPLLQPHRVPRDVVVDHEPAELEVDPFARRLGRHQDLGSSRGTRARRRCACPGVSRSPIFMPPWIWVTVRPHSRSLPSGGRPCRRRRGSRACPCAR